MTRFKSVNLAKLLEHQAYFVDAATRSSLFLALLILLLNDNRDFVLTAGRIIGSFCLSTVVCDLTMLLKKRLTLIPYLLFVVLATIIILVLPIISLLAKIVVVISLFLAILNPLSHFEWLLYAIPAALYLVSFGMNNANGQIWGMICFAQFFLLQQVTKYRENIQAAQEDGDVTQHFSATSLYSVGLRQFEKNFLLFLIGAVVVIGIAIAQPNWLSSQFLRQQTANSEATEQVVKSKAKVASSARLPQAAGGSPAKEKLTKTVDHKFPTAVFVIMVLIAGVAIIALVYFAVKIFFQQLQKPKVEPDLLSDNNDIVIGQTEKQRENRRDETSVTRRIRRKYQRTIQKKYQPRRSETPADHLAKLTVASTEQAELRKLYEEARYSKAELTKNDYRHFADLLKKRDK